jgi:hypothetical protein
MFNVKLETIVSCISEAHQMLQPKFHKLQCGIYLLFLGHESFSVSLFI